MGLIQGIPGEFEPQPWGEAILRSRELLLLRIACRPPDHEVRLPGLATTPLHVVEDHSGKALTWRRDGDDLVVRLPEAGEPPVVRVALQGKLRIVPPDTVTANADGVWDLTPTGTPAHLVARRATDVAVRFIGMAEPDSRHQIRLAGRRYGVTGHQLTRTTIGPFPMPERRVVALPVPTGATSTRRTPAGGEVELPLPAGWSATDQAWTFDGLDPGRSVGWVTRVEGPAGAHELLVRLDAGRRSASSPYVVALG